MSLGTLTNISGPGGFPANGLTFIDRDSLSYAIAIVRHAFSASTARNRMPLIDCRSNCAELKVVVVPRFPRVGFVLLNRNPAVQNLIHRPQAINSNGVAGRRSYGISFRRRGWC